MTGSESGRIPVSPLPVAAAVLLTAAAITLACALNGRRSS